MFRIISKYTLKLSSDKICNKSGYNIFQLKRNFSTYVMKNDQMKCLKITNGRKSTSFHYIWLRDHCRCDTCYNSITSQRRLSISDIPNEVKPKAAHIDDSGVLRIIWEGGHKSEYSVSWLEECLYENYIKRTQRDYVLWTKLDVNDVAIAHVEYTEFLKSENCLISLIKSLVDYGVGFIENVPVNTEGTELAAKRIGQVQNTLFGEMWEFSDVMDHSDSAYTREALEAHTDNTYFTEAAGLQILHCLHHEGTGGETLLVDGFKAASILKDKFPDVFNRLTKMNVGAEYIEDGQHHLFYGPIIRVRPLTKEIEQIRFNINDRATLILPQDEILDYYDDLRILTEIIKDQALEWSFKITPGTMLIVDNFRILHGRAAYTGNRRMCGCYISRSDFLSKARVLNILGR